MEARECFHIKHLGDALYQIPAPLHPPFLDARDAIRAWAALLPTDQHLLARLLISGAGSGEISRRLDLGERQIRRMKASMHESAQRFLFPG